MTPLSGILGIISGIAQGIAGWFGFAKQKDEQLNAPDIKKNQIAREDAAVADAMTKDIADALKTGDLSKVRKDASEN